MLLRMTSSLDLKVKYLQPNGKGYRYKRRIPKAIAQYFEGFTFFEKSIKAKTSVEAARIAQAINRDFENLLKSVEEQERLGIPSAELVQLLTAKWGAANDISYDDFGDPFHASELLIDELQDRDQREILSIMQSGKSQLEAERIVTTKQTALPHERAYLASLSPSTLTLTLSTGTNEFLKNHSKGNRASLVKDTRLAVKSFVELLGFDPKLEDIDRKMVQRWMQLRADQSVSASTIQRNLNQLNAVAAYLEREHGAVGLSAHFKRQQMPSNAIAPLDRLRPTINQVSQIVSALNAQPAIKLLVLLGLRVGELVGIERADVHLDEPIPFVKIQPKNGKTLKTETSKRDLPLVGGALAAMQQLLDSETDGLGLLPKFYEPKNGANNFSNFAKTHLQKVDHRFTAHCFRHGLKDLLREAEVDKELSEALLGHAPQNVGGRYGSGFSLNKKREALKRAYFLINQ